MTDTVLTLGSFAFARFEVPEEIAFGGVQQLVVHRLVGGKRVVDSMGADPRPLEWSGIFVGANALDRALELDALRKAGKPLSVTWSELRYTVVIAEVDCTFRRFYRVPYRIRCEVISDDTAPNAVDGAGSIGQALSDDASAASSLAAGLGDDELAGLVGDVQTGIANGNQTLTAAAQTGAITGGAFDAVIQPLSMAQALVGDMLLISGQAIAGTQQVPNLTAQAVALSGSADLVTLGSTLGRIATNIAQLSTGTRSVTTVGGDLYSVAASEYGDPMQWTAIARASGLSDPELAGVANLVIPAVSGLGALSV